jgi:putative intracellular protease/amidase
MKMKFFTACVIVLSVLFSLVSGVISSAVAEPKEKILVVLSGVDYVSLNDGSTHETGFYLSELATPLRILASKGFEFEFANPTGREALMDKTSDARNYFKDEKDYAAAKELLNNKDFKAPKKLSSYGDEKLAGFAGIFLPGGHAPMEDLYRDADLGRILAYFHKAGKPTALSGKKNSFK